ncbi:hypothetical protein [Promicromonospora sp. NPDC023805]|uniref:phage terminase small subunit n=1 Tax=Promicromonospora sp. NPDC023805 TaxID=3154696 RepID=UPI00340B4A3A
MAGRGPAPTGKSEGTRRRNAPTVLTVVKADDVLRGEELPELPGDDEWPDATLEWWDTWRRSPQAQNFTDTDWSFLLDTALLHMAFWDGDAGVAAELRLRVAKFGATPEDRARLRLSIGDAPGRTKPAPAGRRPAARTRRKADISKAIDAG